MSLPAPSSLASLWRRAEDMFARAIAAIGAPAALAARPAITAEISGWIARLEHIVRKLLFVEAAQLRDDAPAPAGRSARLLPRNSSARIVDDDDARSNLNLSAPETWSARFSLAPPRDPRAVEDAHAPRIRSLDSASPAPAPAPQKRTQSARANAPFRFARRLEALRRVLENPAPHALRLARLLARAVRRYPEVMLRFALAAPSLGWFDPADPRLGNDVMAPAFAAAYGDTS